MSDVTEVGDTDSFPPESFQSNNQKSEMQILQLNLATEKLQSTLKLPDQIVQEPENYQHGVQLDTFQLHSSTEVDNNSINVDFSPTYTMCTNYQKCEINNSLTLDLNVQEIDIQFVNKDSQTVDQNKQTIEHCEIKNVIMDPIAKASEEQCEGSNIRKLKTSFQESKPLDENKDLALIQNSSIHDVLQTDKSHNPSPLITPTTEEIQSHTEIIQSRHSPASVNVDAPIHSMLTYIWEKIFKSESKVEESLIVLDCMKRIENWYAKLDKLNQNNTAIFQALLEKMVEFKRLESLVKDKKVMLTLGKDLSFFEVASNFERSTYRSFYGQCESILRLLKLYERHLNASYKRQSKLRMQYLDCSLQIAMFPIEEKLFKNRKQMMNIINQASKSMNKMSSKIEEIDRFIDNLSLKCISTVNNFIHDCEETFSQ